MFCVGAVLAWSVCLLQTLVPAVADNGCTFKDGACTYNIHLTYRDGTQAGQRPALCGSTSQQVVLEPAQNDYAAKIDDMEKNFSVLRDVHEQRIKELESTVKELRATETSTSYQPQEQVINEVSKHRSTLTLMTDPMAKKLEEEFNKLRDEVKRKTEDLLEANTRLNETNILVHEVQLQYFQTSQHLLNADNEITTLKRERAVLKNQLKDRIYRMEVIEDKAGDCEVKYADMQELTAKLFRSENNLQEQLMTVELRENQTRHAHRQLQTKHDTLRAKHDKMRVIMKMREQELIECFAAKTNTFCGFEDPKICGFTNVNDSSDFFNWERGRGQTPSPGTGPSRDHTCGSSNGYFMFIEASAKSRGNNAILFSPVYRGLSEQCVEFFYHMNGKHVGTLNVYAQVTGDILKSAWRAYGNQGDVWTKARLGIPQELAMAGYQIAFEGITENGYLGDISIDDVSVTDGPCPLDDQLTPVAVEVNSTTVARNIRAFARKLSRRQRVHGG